MLPFRGSVGYFRVFRHSDFAKPFRIHVELRHRYYDSGPSICSICPPISPIRVRVLISSQNTSVTCLSTDLVASTIDLYMLNLFQRVAQQLAAHVVCQLIRPARGHVRYIFAVGHSLNFVRIRQHVAKARRLWRQIRVGNGGRGAAATEAMAHR